MSIFKIYLGSVGFPPSPLSSPCSEPLSPPHWTPTQPPPPPPDPRAIHSAHCNALALSNDNQTVLSLLKCISSQLLLKQSSQPQQGPAPSTPGPCTPGAGFHAGTQILPTCGSPHVHPPWTATLLSVLSGYLSSSCIFGGDFDSLKRTFHDPSPLSWYSSYRGPTDVCNHGLSHVAAVSHPRNHKPVSRNTCALLILLASGPVRSMA